MPDREYAFPPRRIHRRRRKCRVCDSCYKKKIKCDLATPKCNWCYHHDLACTYTRTQERKIQNKKPKPSVADLNSCPPSQARVRLRGVCILDSDSQLSPYAELPTDGSFSTEPDARLLVGNICAFNGLPFFSSSGRQWINEQTGEDINLAKCLPPTRAPWLCGRALPERKSSSTVPLPNKDMLYQYLERYTYSTFSQIFPFINPLLFEHTVQAAYGEDHPTNFAPAAAKACVFAFMSVASVALNESNNGSISNMDDYALEAYYLLPDLLGHTMTVDGLQALLMLCFYSQAIVGDLTSMELLLSFATRLVFHLGGHTRRSEMEPSLRNSHNRKLFWLCYILNYECSLRTGLPPNFNDEDCDLTMPQTPHGLSSSPGSNTLASFFLAFARLAVVESQIFRRLYSVSSQQKTDAELLGTIRDLDELLEDWKYSIPEEARPGFTPRATDAVNMPSSILQLNYHFCMATIHQASGRCTFWTQNLNTRELGSSLAVSVEASRSLLRKFSNFELEFHRYNLLFFLPYFTGAMIHLFCNLLLNPLDQACHADLDLWEVASCRMEGQIWPQAPNTFKMQVEFMKGLSLELRRLAQGAIYKAMN